MKNAVVNRITILICFICAFALLVVPGCSQSTPSNGITSSGTSSTASKTVSELFTNNGRMVWYRVYDGIGKDSEVEAIYVFDDGLATVYNLGMYNMCTDLGQVSKATDDAAINYAESAFAEKISTSKYPDDVSKELTREADFSITAHTDRTGNNVVSETISIGDDPEKFHGTELNINCPRLVSGQVYDQHWIGFDVADGSNLITRDPGYMFTLDTVSSPGIFID